MTADDSQEPLKGLARSIDSLFGEREDGDASDAAPSSGEPDELVPAGDDEPAEAPSGDDDAPVLSGRGPSDGSDRESARRTVESADPFMDMEVLPVSERDPRSGPRDDTGEIRGAPMGMPVDEGELEDVVSLDEGLSDDDDLSAIVREVVLEPDPASAEGSAGSPGSSAGPEAEPDDPDVAEAPPDGPEPEAEPSGSEAEPNDEAVSVDVWQEAPRKPGDGPGPTGSGEAAEGSPVGRASAEGPSGPAGELSEAVERFVSGGASEELARRIRELAATLRSENTVDPIVDAVERLVETSDDGDVQDAPVALARVVTTPLVAGRLAARLGSARHEDERERLVHVMSALGHEAAVALADALAETDHRAARRAFMEALVALGDDAMDVVEEMVDDSRWFVVRNAVLVLGQTGGEQAVQYLTSTLAHEQPKVRRETLLALAKIGGEDAAMLVTGKLGDPDPGVRAAAAMACGELEVEKSQRDLVELLESDDDTDVQVAVLRALGQLGDPGAVQAIEKRAVGSFFSRPATEVRIAAYRALASIGTPHARKLLQDAADDRDPAVKSTARDLLDD